VRDSSGILLWSFSESKDKAYSPTPADVSVGRIENRPYDICFLFQLEARHKEIWCSL